MATIQIRDFPGDDADVFRKRAAAERMSLQAYLRRELIAAARRGPKAEAMAAIREALERDDKPGVDRDSILWALNDARGA